MTRLAWVMGFAVWLAASASVSAGTRTIAVTGTIDDMQGNRAGTLSGLLRGTYLEYGYQAITGASGVGRGQVAPDGGHLNIEVRDNATGLMQRHTLHKNHLPNQ